MKAVMLSIRPKWCDLIANGKKTVEVRKTRPKIPTPFKCYIYCTKDPKLQFWTGPRYSYADDHSHNQFDRCGNGKVIGEFVCDDIEEYLYDYCTHPEIGMDYDCGDSWWEIDKEDLERACMTYEQFMEYVMPNTDCMFGWHISDLVIYDTPRGLNEFHKPGKVPVGMNHRLNVPPQSFCYVEEML